MRSIVHSTLAWGLMVALTGCGGDSKDSADRAAEAQKAMQQELQKEQNQNCNQRKKYYLSRRKVPIFLGLNLILMISLRKTKLF